MRRFRDDRPADVCFARGTFNSHPYVMSAMDEFLSRLASPNFRAVYNGLDETWNGRRAQLNEMMEKADLPVRFANLSSIWTVNYTEPSRYNWMLQYYLRAEGLALSWVGTGRLIFSLNYTDADFAEVAKRFVSAATKMKQDGWWWRDAALTNKAISRQILKEMLAHAVRALRSARSSSPSPRSFGRSSPSRRTDAGRARSGEREYSATFSGRRTRGEPDPSLRTGASRVDLSPQAGRGATNRARRRFCQFHSSPGMTMPGTCPAIAKIRRS